MAELPRLGTPMYLVHSEETNYRSRLEAVEGDMLSVAAPLEQRFGRPVVSSTPAAL